MVITVRMRILPRQCQEDVNSQIRSLCHVNLCRKNYVSYQILNMQVDEVLVIVAVIAEAC